MNIDGNAIAKKILDRVAEGVKLLPRPPRIEAFLIGAEKELKRFLEIKKDIAEKVGMEYNIQEFPESITTKEFRAKIVQWGKRDDVDGIIIELPFPKHLKTQYILNAVPPEKDPDVLSQRAQGAFFVGRSPVLSPAAAAVKAIFETHNINPKDVECVSFGYGLLIGRQVAHWLLSEGSTVSVMNMWTQDQAKYARQADVIITGVGKPKLVTGEMVKEGAVVIDFGYAKDPQTGAVSGDVDFDEVAKKASLITPVRGGTGPLVGATMLENMLTLAKQRLT